MFDKLKQIFHSPNSFINHGFAEKSTWVAVAMLIFGFIFGRDIYALIHNLLNNSRTVDLLITSLPVIISFVLAWMKEKK